MAKKTAEKKSKTPTKTIERICLFTNYNLYESKRHFTEKLAEALERRGIKTAIFDSQQQALEAEMAIEIMNFAPDLTCSFNTIAQLPSGNFLWDIMKIPHWSILVDPSLYSLNLTSSPYSIMSCVDDFDCELLQAHGFDKAFFWPHAVESSLSTGSEKRIYDVVFLGSCNDYESIRKTWQEKYPAAVHRILDRACDIVLSEKTISLASALVAAWDPSVSPKEVEFTPLLYCVDSYTRGKDRVELIRAIKDVPVHVFGEIMWGEEMQFGWDHYLGKQKNVTIHPSVPFQESLKILQRSKISLNSSPFFKSGSHERVFTGLASGALPVTTDSLYWREQFVDGEDLVIYKPGKWDEVNKKIHNVLADPSKREAMVTKGRAKVMKSHTWDARVDQLLQVLPGLLAKTPQKR